ncbi:hypothetical protein LQ327_03275 [Actinomycetospora endophytica]|uniref:Small secreted domain DUF320 n=1 Tax=Actinomycetospora endophytica TaxID=2291215 RepID=A0ABS8P2D5_9PSEU|nr:hypothetical protein [Actinomycetospora endophytica]MCD2192417.1 hypothetical protein [Actinomycetospora endophytica]
MFRRAAVATAILGAGLASTTGAAMATTSHGHGHDDGHGCSNTIDAKNLTKGGGLDVAGGDQVAAPINACHILDDNKLLNGNNVAALAGTITNGDTTTTSGIPDSPVTIPVIQS